MNNPLLNLAELPDYSCIRAAHVEPGILQLLRESRQALKLATSDVIDAHYAALDAVLSKPLERLSQAWGVVGHLSSVMNSAKLREAHLAVLPAVSTFFAGLASNAALYAKYQAIEQREGPQLTGLQQRVVQRWLRDAQLAGVKLQGANKQRFESIVSRLAQLSQQFSDRVMDATDAFSCCVHGDELAGLPADVLRSSAAEAEARGQEGHRLSLQMPVYLPVMKFARHRPLRERLYRAHISLASDVGDAAFDNSAVMTEIVTLRQEQAVLLGFANFAEFSLAAKMADTPAQVLAFLHDLARRSRSAAQRDLAELREFARSELGLGELQPWDMLFAAEQLKQVRHAFDSQQLREYFGLGQVLHGLFKIAQDMYQIRIVEAQTEVWHPSVRYYRIERAGHLLGSFYLDA